MHLETKSTNYDTSSEQGCRQHDNRGAAWFLTWPGFIYCFRSSLFCVFFSVFCCYFTIVYTLILYIINGTIKHVLWTYYLAVKCFISIAFIGHRHFVSGHRDHRSTFLLCKDAECMMNPLSSVGQITKKKNIYIYNLISSRGPCSTHQLNFLIH